jgi:hypothetical protein
MHPRDKPERRCYVRGVAEHWIAFHRPGDGDLSGYLDPIGHDEFVPLNLIGHPIGEAGTRTAAESVLADRGLTSLANYWWARAPRPMPQNGLDLRAPEDDWEWRRFVVVDLDKSTCTVRLALPEPDEEEATAVVSLPADDVLRVGPPHRD